MEASAGSAVLRSVSFAVVAASLCWSRLLEKDLCTPLGTDA